LYQRIAVRTPFAANATETWATLAVVTTALNDQSTPGVIGGVNATAFTDGERINLLDLTTGTEGVYVVTGTPGSAATLVLETDTADDWANVTSGSQAELAFIRSFIGKASAGSETPDYGADVAVVGQTDDLETAIGKLDAELQLARTVTTDAAVTTIATLDSVLVDDYHTVEWVIFAQAVDGSIRKIAYSASHNGTTGADADDVDTSSSDIHRIGNIVGLKISVDLNGTTTAQVMRLRVESTTEVAVKVLRASVL
jgi:hypothetical protein